MNAQTEQWHRREIAGAYIAARRLRLVAAASAVLGAIGLGWTVIAMAAGAISVVQGIGLVVGTALAAMVPAASLHAASFRTSLGAARLERDIEGGS